MASTAVGDKGGMRSEAYGHDALGSVTEVVQYGMLQASYRYDAFGKTYEGALSSGERGYNGKPYNAVTGHYNYGYRDYDPMTGRFATVDPIRDGMNWYVYTRNDPVNHIDPWGLATEDGGSTKYVDFWRLKAQRDGDSTEYTDSWMRDSVGGNDVGKDQKAMDGYNVFSTVDGIYKGSKWNNPEKKTGPESGLGYYASVKDSEGNWYNYGHLNPDHTPDLKIGDEVQKGVTIIGRIADPATGNADARHVHVQKNVRTADGSWTTKDPGPTNPLGDDNARETAGYPSYPDGTKHNGRDFAPYH